MKKFSLIVFLILFSVCFSQKKTTTSKKMPFTSKDIFYSGQNGGTSAPSFYLIKNQEELDKAVVKEVFTLNDENTDNQKIKFPKNRKVIKYNLGEFRSGDHTPNKLKGYRVNGDTLELYIENEIYKIDDLEFSIQIVTRPYIIFSVPKKVEFNKIAIIYE